MRFTYLLQFAFLCALWNIAVSSKRDDDGDDDDDHREREQAGGRAADIQAVEREMVGLERDLRMGERQFKRMWRGMKTSSGMSNDPTLLAIRSHTQRMRRDLSRGFRSLNDFMNCLDLCHTSHHDGSHEASEAHIQYFCNHSCLMVANAHEPHEPTDDDGDHRGSGLRTQTTPPLSAQALVG